MIGSANVFRFSRTLVFGTNVVTLTPPGDLPGLYWGAFRALLNLDATPTKPTSYAASVLITLEVAGAEIFRHRHIQRNWWRPRQLYQTADFQNGNWTNFRWSSQGFADATVTPTGTLIGNYTGSSNGSPKRSYQSAFWEPNEQGPANAPLGFGAGTVPTAPAQFYWANAEPVWFTASVQPGQAIQLRARVYREAALPNTNPAITDTPPSAGSNAEPDETEYTQPGVGGIAGGLCEGWLIRTGGTGQTETIETIGAIGLNPGEGQDL